jgi:hypothetical protein
MPILQRYLAALVLGSTLLATASPSFAQPRGHDTSAARAAAIRECSARASQYSEPTWGNLEFDQYRACMAEHGQRE